MHHCGRSISGARARGSFARSRWYVVGLRLLVSFPTAQLLGGRQRDCTDALSPPPIHWASSKWNLIIHLVGEVRPYSWLRRRPLHLIDEVVRRLRCRRRLRRRHSLTVA